MWKCILVAYLFVAFPNSGMGVPQSPAAPPGSWLETPDDGLTRSSGGPTVEVPPLHSADMKQKDRKWSGNLVDAGCMASALRQIPSIDQMLSPEPLGEYYLQGTQTAQSSQAPQPGAGVPTSAPATRPAGQPEAAREPSGEPETSARELAMQAAQLHRAEMVKEKVQMCTPRRLATQFVLFTSGDHLVKFDASGNLKTLRALNASAPAPGKPIKAKVTGVLTEGEDTVLVASVEINGQVEGRLSGFEPITILVLRTAAPAVYDALPVTLPVTRCFPFRPWAFRKPRALTSRMALAYFTPHVPVAIAQITTSQPRNLSELRYLIRSSILRDLESGRMKARGWGVPFELCGSS